MNRIGSLTVQCVLLTSAALTAAEPEESEMIPLEFSEGSHVIVLSVNLEESGEPQLFLVDPLEPYAVLDERLRRHAGSRVRGTKLPQSVAYYQSPGLDVGGCSLQSAPAEFRDLSTIRERIGADVAGILSADQLRLMYFRVNVARGRFDILPPINPIRGSKFFIRARKTSQIAIKVQLGNQDVTSVLDAGFASRQILTLDSELFDLLVKQGDVSLNDGSSIDLLHEGVLSRLKIGEHAYENVPVHKGSRNTFGLLLFQNDTLTLDVSMGKGALARNTAPHKREWVPWHGMAIAKPGGKITITRVAPQGPAARAGLAAGDVIESINGGPARFLPVSEVEFHAAWDAGRVEIEFIRDGQIRKTTVVQGMGVRPREGDNRNAGSPGVSQSPVTPASMPQAP